MNRTQRLALQRQTQTNVDVRKTLKSRQALQSCVSPVSFVSLFPSLLHSRSTNKQKQKQKLISIQKDSDTDILANVHRIVQPGQFFVSLIDNERVDLCTRLLEDELSP